MDQQIDFQHARLTSSSILLGKTIRLRQIIRVFYFSPCMKFKLSDDDFSQQSHSHWFTGQICMASLINQYLFYCSAGWYCRPLDTNCCSCGHLGSGETKRSLWRVTDGTRGEGIPHPSRLCGASYKPWILFNKVPHPITNDNSDTFPTMI